VAVKRIVIAEDEPLIRLDLRESLIEEGYDVVGEAADGAEAVELIQRLKPDAAILDIKMPKMDGLEAARQVVGQRLCAVVVLTAFSQRDLVEQARDAGALAYLIKPYQQTELVPAVELAVARFRELVALSEQSESLAQQLETRKLVDRAKGLLMDRHAMSENDAFRFLQQTAMSSRTSMKQVALQVVDGDLTP
jgi:response regulator NasT